MPSAGADVPAVPRSAPRCACAAHRPHLETVKSAAISTQMGTLIVIGMCFWVPSSILSQTYTIQWHKALYGQATHGADLQQTCMQPHKL